MIVLGVRPIWRTSSPGAVRYYSASSRLWAMIISSMRAYLGFEHWWFLSLRQSLRMYKNSNYWEIISSIQFHPVFLTLIHFTMDSVKFVITAGAIIAVAAVVSGAPLPVPEPIPIPDEAIRVCRVHSFLKQVHLPRVLNRLLTGGAIGNEQDLNWPVLLEVREHNIF